MGSKPCCCKNTSDPIQEMKLKIEPMNSIHEILVADLKKPIPLEQIMPLQQEDDFALFLVMDQYDRLIVKSRTKAKSYSPAGDIYTNSRENFTTYYMRRKTIINSLSTSFQSIGIRSILKKDLTNNKSSYFQQISDVQKSIKSVHFDMVQSPKNCINRQTDVLKNVPQVIYMKSET